MTNASIGSDASASGGQYIQFNAPGASGILGQASSCVFQMADKPLQQAFCDDFSGHHNGGTQTGDLDTVLWGVSRRFDFDANSKFDGVTPSHNACSGGGTTGNPNTGDSNSTYFGPATPPPLDARICNGIYVSSNNDGGVDVTALDAYPKQPFSFANRTGTVVFDVTDDDSGSHGAWPEFWITDEPVPGFLRCVTVCPNTTHAENSIGFSLAGSSLGNMTGVDVIAMTKGGVYSDTTSGPTPITLETFGTMTKGCLAGHSYQCNATKMNHIEVRVSITRIDIYGTDAGSTTLKHLAGANLPGGLGFNQGLVWINDVHYNAKKAVEPCECGTQYDHSFGWDNLGFDGIKTYRDLGYDVPLNNQPAGNNNHNEQEVAIGYLLNGSKTWSLPNVTWSKTPTKAKVVFNVYSYDNANTISASLNGHTAVSKVVDGHPNGGDNSFRPWSMSIDLPPGDAVQGTNSLKLTASSGTTVLANVSLIMVNAAPVP